MTRQQLIAEIRRKRIDQKDSEAVKLWMKFGGVCKLSFRELTKIDPRREIEEEEEKRARASLREPQGFRHLERRTA